MKLKMNKEEARTLADFLGRLKVTDIAKVMDNEADAETIDEIIYNIYFRLSEKINPTTLNLQETT